MKLLRFFTFCTDWFFTMGPRETLFISIFPSLPAEIEMFVQTKGRTRHNVTAAEVTEKQQQTQQQTQTQSQEEKMKMSAVPDRGRQGALPTIITVLLLSPLVVLLSVGLYLCRRNSGKEQQQQQTPGQRSTQLTQWTEEPLRNHWQMFPGVALVKWR